jgi:hypothetical protein
MWSCSKRERIKLAELVIFNCLVPNEDLIQLVSYTAKKDYFDAFKLLILGKQVPIDENVLVDNLPLISWAMMEIRNFRFKWAEVLLVHRKLPIDDIILDNKPLLIWACESSMGCMKRAVEYICNRSDTNLNVQKSNGETALHVACRIAVCDKYHIKVVQLLMNRSNDPASTNIQDHEGNTPLHVVSNLATNRNEKFCLVIMDSLLAYRPNVVEVSVNIQNRDGDTALHIMCRKNKEKLVERLYSFRLLVRNDIRNNANETANSLANQTMKKTLRRKQRRSF